VQVSARLRWIDGHYFSPVLLRFCARENADTWKMQLNNLQGFVIKEDEQSTSEEVASLPDLFCCNLLVLQGLECVLIVHIVCCSRTLLSIFCLN
jgi:hypothetical protein